MEFLFPLLLTAHILVGLSVIGLVLLQHGKGADMGAAFGGGASGSLFGASGSANFLSRTTAVLATAFFLTSLGLSYLAGSRPKAPSSVMESPAKPAPNQAPGLPADGKLTIPSGEKPATTPVPSPAVPVDKEAAPAPAGDKAPPTGAGPASDASKADTKLSSEPKTVAPIDKAGAPASKVDGSAAKVPAPADKKLPEPTNSQAGSASKAKEIPK